LTVDTTGTPGTTTTPSVTPSPSAVNQSTTVAALVTNSSTSAPVDGRGTVSFFENSTLLNGPLPVGSDGVASFLKSDFTQGAHFVDANYSGAPGFFNLSTGRVLHYVDAPTTNPSAGQFCNSTPVSFPNTAGASGSPYPTRVAVSGLAGVINKVTVSLAGLRHNSPRDMDMMLTGPNGNSLVVLSDLGGSTALTTPVDLTLDSTASSALPSSSALTSGTFRPTDVLDGADSWAAPAPTTNVFSAATTMLDTAFTNSLPNGVWTLWTANDGSGAAGGGSLDGGWCLNVTTTRPQLTISKTPVGGSFTQGQTDAQYSVVVGSSGPGFTAGAITAGLTVPASLTVTGMSGNGWSCTVGTLSCTTSAVLAANATLPPITVTMNVAPNAPAAVSSSSSATGGGANAASESAPTTIAAVPDLVITKTTSGLPFEQGGMGSYALTVINSGGRATSGSYTISDSMPTGLTVALPLPVMVSGWDCSASTNSVLNCVRSLAIDAGASAPPVNFNVNIESNAPLSITNTATIAGGGEVNTGNNSGSVTSPVSPLPADLTISKTTTSTFQQGGTASYTLTVTNIGNSPTTSVFTVSDTMPTGLTVSLPVMAAGFDCSGSTTSQLTCASTSALAGSNATRSITLPVNIAANAPSAITNTATVSGGGETRTNNNSGSVVVPVTGAAPNLTIALSTSSTNIRQVSTVRFEYTVTNIGSGPTTSAITVTNNLPAGLSVNSADFSCVNPTFSQFVCTFGSLAAGESITFINFVNVTADAPESITNTATVSGGGDTSPENNSSSVTFAVGPALVPDLTISKTPTASGPFAQGDNVTFTLVVSNSGDFLELGPYTVTDNMPTGMTAVSAIGSDWNCTIPPGGASVSCVRARTIRNGGSASPITLVTQLSPTAGASITNTASVSGGRERNTANNSGSATISVIQPANVTIDVPPGVSFSFNGQSYTGPQTIPTAAGTYVLSTTTPQSLGAGSRAVFSSWSNGQPISHNLTVGSTALTITGNFTTQFQLTTAASPSNGGTVTPASGTFYDSGSVVNLSATANSGFVFGSWTGGVASASAAATTVTMDAAKAVTANFTAQTGVTISVPAGVSYSFNGQSVTGSQTFNVAPGTYALSTTTPQSLAAGSRAVFSSWSNGQPISHNLTVGSTALTITGNFTTQFQLTTAASPSNGGTVTPASGTFYDSGTVVNLSATATSGFVFGSWTGGVANASAAATTVTMDAAKAVTANFTAQTGVTISVPAGVSYSFNGQSVTGSQTFNVAPGTYALSTTTPQSLGAGSRAVFSSWSNGQPISHNVTVGSTALTITGNFTTQFQLTTAASPSNGGTVTPASGTFYDSGTVVNLSATATSGFVFGSWTGGVANASAAATTVTMDAAKAVTANFTAQTGVTISVPAGVSYSFNGQSVTGSQTFNVAPGTYALSTTTPQSLGAGSRAVFSSWSNGQPISHNVTVGSTALTITGNFTTQFQLTTAASPSNGGTVTPASGTFYDSGTVVNLSATATSGFVFGSWTGGVASASSPATTVTMDAAKAVTANFTAQTGVTISVPAGVSYSFNGQSVTGSQTFNVAPGTYALSTTTPQSLGAGSRAVFSSWSNGQPISHNVTVGSTALTITGTFTTQFQLTTAASPSNGGTVTPASGTFYDSGSVVTVSATANGGFGFTSWTGAVAIAGSAATTVTMDAAKAITANFTTQFLLTTVANNIGAGSGSITPGTGFQNAGLVNVSATPNACSVFTGWSGATVTNGQVNLTGPLTLTASFSAPVAAMASKGTLQTVRGTPQRYRQAVSVLNATGATADISIIVDTFGGGVSVVSPAAPSGLTTNCTGAGNRAFYTIPNVAPGAFGTVTFDFDGPNAAGITYNASAVIGTGPR
jgi:uncharacterized repeat protein (TIGR01451 family)